MSVTRYNFDGNADGYFDDPFMKVQEQGKFVLHSDYSTILARLAALVDVVAWERECEAVRNQLRPFRNWPELAESVDSYQAARAEVDRLIANETEPTG